MRLGSQISKALAAIAIHGLRPVHQRTTMELKKLFTTAMSQPSLAPVTCRIIVSELIRSKFKRLIPPAFDTQWKALIKQKKSVRFALN